MKKTKLKKQILNYTVVFEPAEEGGYIAHVPLLPGCHTQGKTLDEAYKMVQDAISLYVVTLRDESKEVPLESQSSFTAKVPVYT